MANLYVTDVVKTALNEVGYQGSKYSSKYSKELDSVKFYNYPKDGACTWCSIFADWCIYVNTFPQTASNARALLCEPEKDNCGAGCQQSAQYYKNKGRYYTKMSDAHTGDKIFFKNSSGIYHSGIVVDWDNSGIYTVEGSTDGAKVTKRFYPYGDSRVAGFGRPYYTAYEHDNEPTPEPAPDVQKYQVKVGDYLSIRTGPSTDNKKIGELLNGAIITIIEERDGWARITGDSWVSMSYLTKV